MTMDLSRTDKPNSICSQESFPKELEERKKKGSVS